MNKLSNFDYGGFGLVERNNILNQPGNLYTVSEAAI